MAENKTTAEKKIKSLLADLSSADEAIRLGAVQALKVNGNETVIEPLLLVLVSDPAVAVKQEIADLLNTTKSSKVPAEIAKALLDARFVEIRQTLLSSIWNSGLDYAPYLKEIMIAGTQGEMMDALECITILENMETDLTEDEIFEPLLVLTEYLGANPSETGPKMDLLKEVAETLKQKNNLL